MRDWENIRFFVSVAEAGTLSRAARALKVDHATVSRRITALEAALGVRLVDRLPRACRLTEIGEQVFARASAMGMEAHGIERLAQSARQPLAGRVTLSAPPVLVAHLLADQLGRFRTDHPTIRLSISAQGQQVSLSRREADVALRLVRPEEAGSVARKIGSMAFGLYAHHSYAQLSLPEQWQFIAFEQSYDDMPQQRWLKDIAGDRPTVCELNHISEHLIAARAGAGVAGLPCFLGDRDAELVRLETDVAPFARDIWLVVHRDFVETPKVRAVMNFVAAVVKDNGSLSAR